MAAQFNIDAYSDALVLLGTAGIVVPMVRRFGLSPVLGFLAAGALLGPLGLGSLIHAFPFLYWLTVVDAKNVAGIAELGVVFLLFLIGLELSYERLKALRRLVFGLGSLQFILTTAVIAGIAALFGNPSAVSIILGACLALSSTAIVIEVLSNQGRLGTTAGRTSFAILLAQDLAVIPVLVFISILGKGSSSSVMTSLALALVNATARRCRDGHLRTSAAEAAVPAGRRHRRQRIVRGGHPVRHYRHRRRRRRGRPFDGAGRLRRRIAARRDGIPQGHRNNHRPFQGTAARLLLLYRRHEHRCARTRTRTILARCLRHRPHRHQVHPAHRPRPDLSTAVACGDRNRPAARPRRRVRVRRHRPCHLARPDQRQCVELHAGGDVDHDGADPGAGPGRTAAGAEVSRAQGARSGTERCTEWRHRTCHRHRARPGR